MTRITIVCFVKGTLCRFGEEIEKESTFADLFIPQQTQKTNSPFVFMSE